MISGVSGDGYTEKKAMSKKKIMDRISNQL